MKRILLSSMAVLCILLSGYGQSPQGVAINTTGALPDHRAILDVSSNSKGILIPRMSSAVRNSLLTTRGLLVYDTTTNTFWYHTGMAWQNIAVSSGAGDAWLIGGNTGTVDSVNFLGTVDNEPLSFRVNNEFAGRIDHLRPNTSYGYASGKSITTGFNNTAVGFRVLEKNTSGFENTGLGFYVLNENTTGNNNAGFGNQALKKNTSGVGNIAFGSHALEINTTGSTNIAVGVKTLMSNTTGDNNTAIGSSALFSNATGHNNTALGREALWGLTSGGWNTAVGASALRNNSTGRNNTAVGNLSQENAGGIFNTSVGEQSMRNATAMDSSVAIGAYSLTSTATGRGNTAVGFNSQGTGDGGQYNTSLGHNSLVRSSQFGVTAVGAEALVNNLADSTTAVGYRALSLNYGKENSAFGFRSLENNIGFSGNTAIGFHTLRFAGNFNTAVGARAFSEGWFTAEANTAIGNEALKSNRGGYNTAVGSFSMIKNLNGACNIGVGAMALSENQNGVNNVGIGYAAVSGNTNGGGNIGIGFEALYGNQTGSHNIAIGLRANVASGNLSNAIAIGMDAIVDASNKVRIGNGAITVIEGQVPFTTPSDGRYKYNVQEDVKGLDFIMQLRPVTYQFDVQRFDGQYQAGHNNNYAQQVAYNEAASIRRTGFIAQEVERAADNSHYNFSGVIKPKTETDHYSLSYDAFVVPLVKSVQEQQQIIAAQQKKLKEQEKRIAEMEKKLQQLMEMMNNK